MRAAIGLAILAGGLGFWILASAPQDDAQPDHFELGTVYVGSKLELNVTMLATDGTRVSEVFFNKLMHVMPQSWHSTLSEWHPRALWAKPVVPIDVSTFKPTVVPPSFVRVVKITPGQDHYTGLPNIVVALEVDTSHAGDFFGLVTASSGRRRAELPVHVIVREKPEGVSKLRIAATPYLSSTPSDRSDLHGVARVISASGLAADYLFNLPVQLENYRTIILADDALYNIAPENVGRVRAFVAQGGRLILLYSYFFRGTVESANLILAGNGLQVADVDGARDVIITNLVSDPLTQGVARLELDRPSPIQVTDAVRGKLLALDSAGQGGVVAVARLPRGGEIVVLGTPMWWWWLSRSDGDTDNERLMQNLLSLP